MERVYSSAAASIAEQMRRDDAAGAVEVAVMRALRATAWMFCCSSR